MATSYQQFLDSKETFIVSEEVEEETDIPKNTKTYRYLYDGIWYYIEIQSTGFFYEFLTYTQSKILDEVEQNLYHLLSTDSFDGLPFQESWHLV